MSTAAKNMQDAIALAEAERIRELEEIEVSALASLVEDEKLFRIEWRPETLNDAATLYWNCDSKWRLLPEDATVYTETERAASLKLHVAEKPNGFPEGGQWVELNERGSVLTCHASGEELHGGTPRELAEKAHGEGWLVLQGNVWCRACQAI